MHSLIILLLVAILACAGPGIALDTTQALLVLLYLLLLISVVCLCCRQRCCFPEPESQPLPQPAAAPSLLLCPRQPPSRRARSQPHLRPERAALPCSQVGAAVEPHHVHGVPAVQSTTYFVPPLDKPWGLVSLDWSVASDIWRKPNQSESTVEATSITGCQMIKALFPDSPLLHLPQHGAGAAGLRVAAPSSCTTTASADYFLQYTDGAGHKNGTIYNEPGGPGDQYFWDFRVQDCGGLLRLSSVLSTVSDRRRGGRHLH